MKTIATSLFSLSLLLARLAVGTIIDCENTVVNGKKYDLSGLKGRHDISVIDKSRPPAEYNTTWSLDLCDRLGKVKDIPNEDQCPADTKGKILSSHAIWLDLLTAFGSLRRCENVESCG
jgi:hypothetical protein